MDGKPFVLIIEPDRDICESLAETLGIMGFRVACFPDAASANKELKNLDPSVVLLDYSFKHPGIEELVFELNGKHKNTIVMTTSRQLDDYIAEKLKPFKIVKKPFDFDELITAIQEAAKKAY